MTKWLIKPTVLEKDKISSVMRMLSVANVPFDIVHTVGGIMYNSNKEVYTLNENEQHFVCGSYQLARAVEKIQPSATFLLEDYTFKDWYKIFGKENMLNPNVQFAKPSEIVWTAEEMFVRPLMDTKSFNGGVYNKNMLTVDVECVVAPIQKIQKEFRFFVLGGKIIGKSQYKMNGELFPSSIVDSDAVEFAQEMIKLFDFPGYVIDIASTNGKCSVVELNCFNASGFYEIDLWTFVSGVLDYYENLNFNSIERC